MSYSHKIIFVYAFLSLFTCRILSADAIDLISFKEVFAMGSKEKPAEIVYLKADDSLGKKDEKDTSPAIKLSLNQDVEHLVMQDFTTVQDVKDLHISVEVWASSDLTHGKGDGIWANAEPGIYYIQGQIVHPNVDFWFLRTPGFGYKLTNLDRGHWTTVEASFTSPYASKLHHLEFHVPAGTGFIYLKNFSTKS